MYSFFTKIYQLFFSCFGFENCDTQSIENHSHKGVTYDVFSSKFSVLKKNAVSQKGKVYSHLTQKVHKLRNPPTMPWNELGTPQKLKFGIRKIWNFSIIIRVNNQKTIIEKQKICFWHANFGWYIRRREKTLHWFFQKF